MTREMTHRRRSLLAPALLAGGLLLTAGCGAGTDAAPPVPPVPPVDNAKDARGQDPCALLGAEQLAQFGLPASEPGTRVAEGARCEWRGAGSVSLTVTLFTGGGGLATLARNSESTTARVRVEGYPALETFTGQGEFCQYDVGVAPDQVVMASMENGVPDSCTALQSVLPAILANLPAYQG
ncbi:MAG: DUF3558 family protein [Pseudonocardiaceae bacterium]